MTLKMFASDSPLNFLSKYGSHVIFWKFCIFDPFGPVWSCCTGPSGHQVLLYWPFGPVMTWLTGHSGQFGPIVLGLRASLVTLYWPYRPAFGPVLFRLTSPLGQFGPVVLALRASSVLTYWPFGPVRPWLTGPSDQFGSIVTP